MKVNLTITDLTRMANGHVCVAGYDSKGSCIRPVRPGTGIAESALFDGGVPIAYPFATVQCDVAGARPDPPHTEDRPMVSPRFKHLVDLDSSHRRDLLERSLFDSVRDVFEQDVLQEPGFYVLRGRGPRSLGTIRPKKILGTYITMADGDSPRLRLQFVDGSNRYFELSITDLTWRYYVTFQREVCELTPACITLNLTKTLQSSDVYLRLGLARGWSRYPDRCYIQVTGIHTFDDYLEGHSFADFAPIKNQVPMRKSPNTTRRMRCGFCDGTGFKSVGNVEEICEDCGGNGTVPPPSAKPMQIPQP